MVSTLEIMFEQHALPGLLLVRKVRKFNNFLVVENWHFEGKSGKIEIIWYGWFNTIEGWKIYLGSLWSNNVFPQWRTKISWKLNSLKKWVRKMPLRLGEKLLLHLTLRVWWGKFNFTREKSSNFEKWCLWQPWLLSIIDNMSLFFLASDSCPVSLTKLLGFDLQVCGFIPSSSSSSLWRLQLWTHSWRGRLWGNNSFVKV